MKYQVTEVTHKQSQRRPFGFLAVPRTVRTWPRPWSFCSHGSRLSRWTSQDLAGGSVTMAVNGGFVSYPNSWMMPPWENASNG